VVICQLPNHWLR